MPPLTMEIYIPSLPSLQESLSTTPALVLMTLSVYQGTFSALQLIVGPLSDVYGRRVILLSTLAIYILVSTMAALSPTIYFLLPTRAAQGRLHGS